MKTINLPLTEDQARELLELLQKQDPKTEGVKRMIDKLKTRLEKPWRL